MTRTTEQQPDRPGDTDAEQPRTDHRDSTFWSRSFKVMDDCTLGAFSLTAIIVFGIISTILGIYIFVEGEARTTIPGLLLFLIGVSLVAGASYLCCKSSDQYKALPSNQRNRQHIRARPMPGQRVNTSNVVPPGEQAVTHPLVVGSHAGPPHASPALVPGQPGYTVLVPDPGRPGSYILIPPGQAGSHLLPGGHSVPTAPPLAAREDDLPPAYEDVVKNPPCLYGCEI